MIEITIYGRGGQGTVIASEILASALFKEGKQVQAFPTFGPERRGAPVAAFLRFADEPILLRSQIYRCDHMILLEPTLLAAAETTFEIKPGGWLIINSPEAIINADLKKKNRIASVNALAIAQKYGLTSQTGAVLNTAVLGAFARATELVQLESILNAISEFVPGQKDANLNAAREGFATVVIDDQFLPRLSGIPDQKQGSEVLPSISPGTSSRSRGKI